MRSYHRLSHIGLRAFGLAALFISPAGLASLDLSPQLDTFELDGVTMSQLAFDTGAKVKATYQPPQAWKYSGGGDVLELQPIGLGQVNAKISKLPPAASFSFDTEGCRRLTQKVLASLPEGSEQIKVISEELNPLQIDGKQTYLVELTYVYYGERFACYSLFLDRAPEMLLFRLSCRESNYEMLRGQFHRSLYSWQNL
jgi:hypothetical protein